MTFCLLGVAMPYELIKNPKTTPFNIGVQIPLADFTPSEATGLVKGLNAGEKGLALMERILYWTSGHPYLTQSLGRAVLRERQRSDATLAQRSASEFIDRLCEMLFFNSRARETDDNLLFVRERLLRSGRDAGRLLDLYEQILHGAFIRDDEENDLINQLRLSGIVKEEGGFLKVRNRIYQRVFNKAWLQAVKPLAELERQNGERIQLKESCSMGRAESSDVVLSDVKVSRKHAFIQKEANTEFWLMDLGSRNGTYLNGVRITRTVLLRDQDRIQIGPFSFVFHQPNAPRIHDDTQSTVNRTVVFDRTQFE